MEVKVDGNVMDDNFVLLNVNSPMEVNPDGNTTDVKFAQPLNDLSRMVIEVTNKSINTIEVPLKTVLIPVILFGKI